MVRYAVVNVVTYATIFAVSLLFWWGIVILLQRMAG